MHTAGPETVSREHVAPASGYLSCLHDTDTSYTHKSVKGTVKGCKIFFKIRLYLLDLVKNLKQ